MKLERAGVTQHCEGVKAINATKLHTLKRLNVSCMNFTAVFLSDVDSWAKTEAGIWRQGWREKSWGNQDKLRPVTRNLLVPFCQRCQLNLI